MSDTAGHVIRPAAGEEDYREFARLIGDYVGWMRERHPDEAWMIAEVLDRQSLADELASLPAMYGSPNGRAFLAIVEDEVVGCGAYRRLDATTCEMKRVFVPERFRGAGLGRGLCRAVIDAARADGFEEIKLDTLNRMREAVALYESFGFRECAPYHAYPDALMPHFVFMALRL